MGKGQRVPFPRQELHPPPFRLFSRPLRFGGELADSGRKVLRSESRRRRRRGGGEGVDFWFCISKWRHLVLSGSYFYNSAARFTCKKQCFKLFRGFGAEGPQKLKAFYCISRLFFVYNQMYCGNTRLNNSESSRPNIDQITYFHSFITNATEMLTRPNDCLVLNVKC